MSTVGDGNSSLNSDLDFVRFAENQIGQIPLKKPEDVKILQVALEALLKGREEEAGDKDIRRSINQIRDAITHPEAFVGPGQEDGFKEKIVESVKSTLTQLNQLSPQEKEAYVQLHTPKKQPKITTKAPLSNDSRERQLQLEAEFTTSKLAKSAMTSSQVHAELITDLLDKLPLKTIEDIEKIKIALIRLVRKGEISTGDSDLKGRLENIKETMEDPLAFGYVRDTSEANDLKKTFLKAIQGRIDFYNSLDKSGKEALVKREEESRLRAQAQREKMTNAVPPKVGSPSHTLSEMEWLREQSGGTRQVESHPRIDWQLEFPGELGQAIQRVADEAPTIPPEHIRKFMDEIKVDIEVGKGIERLRAITDHPEIVAQLVEDRELILLSLENDPDEQGTLRNMRGESIFDVLQPSVEGYPSIEWFIQQSPAVQIELLSHGTRLKEFLMSGMKMEEFNALSSAHKLALLQLPNLNLQELQAGVFANSWRKLINRLVGLVPLSTLAKLPKDRLIEISDEVRDLVFVLKPSASKSGPTDAFYRADYETFEPYALEDILRMSSEERKAIGEQIRKDHPWVILPKQTVKR